MHNTLFTARTYSRRCLLRAGSARARNACVMGVQPLTARASSPPSLHLILNFIVAQFIDRSSQKQGLKTGSARACEEVRSVGLGRLDRLRNHCRVRGIPHAYPTPSRTTPAAQQYWLQLVVGVALRLLPRRQAARLPVSSSPRAQLCCTCTHVLSVYPEQQGFCLYVLRPHSVGR